MVDEEATKPASWVVTRCEIVLICEYIWGV